MTHVQTTNNTIDFSVARPSANVVLVAEGKEIHVNKEFLSAFSPYFNTLLMSSDFVESPSARINIDYTYDPLLRCIEVVHGTGPLPIGKFDSASIYSLCQAADRFDLPVVRRYCETEVAAHRTDLVMMFHIACRFKFDQAKTVLLEHITGKDVRDWLASNPQNRFTNPKKVELHLNMVELDKLMQLLM